MKTGCGSRIKGTGFRVEGLVFIIKGSGLLRLNA